MAGVTCPKCMANSPCTREGLTRHFDIEKGPPDPWSYPAEAFGDEFDKVYECPNHGEFGLKDGVAVFFEPDAWVLGPNGEKLFRT